VARLPRAVLYDPELFGIALQRAARLVRVKVDDFQDLRIWRWFTVAALRVVRLVFPNVVVPMAFSNPAYLRELRAGLARFEPDVVHLCLVAPLEVVHERLRGRGSDPVRDEWQYRRAAECCAAHESDEFAVRVPTAGRDVGVIADGIETLLTGE